MNAPIGAGTQARAPARTFVGFGFGAIQAGLFLFEAQASGVFNRLVVAEVVPEVVAALRAAKGIFTVNVAHADRIEAVQVGPVEAYDPHVEADRVMLVSAVAQAQEMATAVPSVRFYASEGPGSIHRLLAAGLAQKAAENGPPAILYAAENHNHAAEILRDAVAGELADDAPLGQICMANTVIGKMSGAPGAQPGLTPMTPGSQRAFLVEAFNRILISPARLESGVAVARGIPVFVEKPDLLPFEEAKLYVHNALHAMSAYLGAAAGLVRMSELPQRPAILALTRRAVLEESGAALVEKYAAVDPLFSPAGMAAYADDLFGRMVNPWLADEIVRVTRDPQRKLAWDDRLVGAMRVALQFGRTPRLLALGAAAALAEMAPGRRASDVVPALWQRPPADSTEIANLCALVDDAQSALATWQADAFVAADPYASIHVPRL